MMSSTSVLKLALGGGRGGGAPRHSVSGRKPRGGSACSSGPGAHSTRIQLRIKVQVANLKISVNGRYRITAMFLYLPHNR
jgi:hypothetical protein